MSAQEEIRRLVTAWMQYDDSARDDLWIDGIISENFRFVVGDKTFDGRDAIRELNNGRGGAEARGTHILSEPNIELTAPGAAVVVTDYVYFEARAGGGYEVALVGQYRDELVQDDEDRWWVSARTNTHLLSEP